MDLIRDMIERSRGKNEILELMGKMYLAVVEVLEGRLAKGFKIVAGIEDRFREAGCDIVLSASYASEADILSAIRYPTAPASPGFIGKNIAWLALNLPFAFGRARRKYLMAIDLADSSRAFIYAAQARAGLGRLFASRGRIAESRHWLEAASAQYRSLGYTAQADRIRGELERK